MTEQQGEWLYEVEERLGMMGVMGPPTDAELSAALRCVSGAARPSIIDGRLCYAVAPAARQTEQVGPVRPIPPAPWGQQLGLFGGRR